MKKTQQLQERRSLPASRQSTPWHAVSVMTGSSSCESARTLGTVRFLSRDAPRLPLAECSLRESCSCAYKHHPDRRGQPRRKEEAVGLRRSNKPVESERRVVDGRRADDRQ